MRRQENRQKDRKDRLRMQKRIGLTGTKEDSFLLKYFEKCTYILYRWKILLTILIDHCRPEWYGKLYIVDRYVGGWFFFGIISFVLLAFSSCLRSNPWFSWFIVFFLAWRLTEIIPYWFHSHLLHRRVASPVRSLIMVFINVIEIVVIFAVLDYLLMYRFSSQAFDSICKSLYYSVHTFTMMGTDIVHTADWIGYLLFYGEVITAVLTIASVVGLVISYFGNRRTQ